MKSWLESSDVLYKCRYFSLKAAYFSGTHPRLSVFSLTKVTCIVTLYMMERLVVFCCMCLQIFREL